jgi:hypothetical protein
MVRDGSSYGRKDFRVIVGVYNQTVARSSKDHDFMAIGRRVVEKAIGEKLSGEPLDDPNAGKNPRAVARGKAGGVKGGAVRAAMLTPTERKTIATKAAKARWGKPRQKSGSTTAHQASAKDSDH